MKFSLYLPVAVTTGGFQTQDAVHRMAVALEGAGADAANVTDHPAPDSAWLHRHGHDALDPFTALAFAAASTTTLLLHTNVVVLPYRNPFLTAKSAATLQTLSGGRFILGVGIGYQEREFEALGAQFTRRGALTDEALDVIGKAWTPGPVTVSGRGFSAVEVEPRPVPNPAPAIWIGGGSERAVERAARYGDGWSPFLAAPTNSAVNRAAAVQTFDELGQKIRYLRDRRSELGRTGAFDVAMDLGGQHHPTERTAAEVRRFADLIGQLAEVGVNWTMLKPPAADVDTYLDAVRWYGEDVLPAAREAAGA